MTTINFEKLEITDGTHTMQMDIRLINDPTYTSAFYKINPFGAGKVSPKIDPAQVPALLERAAAEIFPKFIEYENSVATGSADYKLFNELKNTHWSV